jgi:hypothetical protein
MAMRGVAFMAVIAAAGCVSTAYQRMGSGGGYEDFPKDATTWVVTYRGNEAFTPDRVAMYLHYRCAEVTVEAGQTFFTVLSTESHDETERVKSPGYATTTGTGPTSSRYPYGAGERSTTFTPPQTTTYVRPIQTATIRLSSGTKPEGGFDAREVLRMLAPRLGVTPPPSAAPSSAPAPRGE